AIVFRTARIARIASSDVLSLRNISDSFGVGLGLRRIGARSCAKRGRLYIDWQYETSGKRFATENPKKGRLRPKRRARAREFRGSTLGSMPGKRSREQQIAALDSLRDAAEQPRLEALRKALGNPNNLVVAKAADLARELNLGEVTRDLLAAFDRFFENAE